MSGGGPKSLPQRARNPHLSLDVGGGRFVRLWHTSFIPKALQKEALEELATWDVEGDLDTSLDRLDTSLDRLVRIINIAAGGEREARPLVNWIGGDVLLAIEIVRLWHELHID